MQIENLYFDRDLSWLSFNYRVLMEAKDEAVPLYERIRFLAIYSSNLDEFFRVRVAYLKELILLGKENKSTETEKILKKILETVDLQQKELGEIYRTGILTELRKNQIILYGNELIEESHLLPIKNYFRSKVLAYLQPVIFSEKTRVPFLKNRALYFVLALKRKSDNLQNYALLNIPSEHLTRFYELPKIGKNHYFIFLDDVIKLNLQTAFPGYEVLACRSIKLNRDADLHIEDEYTGDLVEKIKKQLSRRMSGLPSRFLYDAEMPFGMLQFIQAHFQINAEEMIAGGKYHNFNDLIDLPNPLKPYLENSPLPALPHSDLEKHESLLDAIRSKDHILFFPYNSYDYVLRFFNEAAIDPDVSEIKLTVYRIAANSFIANALISAVRNGKKVTVFVEVKARFDEANNLKWAEAMQNEGVKIIYSIPGLKVHAKVALVIRKKGDTREEFAFLGTGNFNESTAKIYTDYGFFTANPEITEELNAVFKYLNKRKEIPVLKQLLVSQFNILPRFKEMIDREIAFAKNQQKAKIMLKLNALEDTAMIDKLYEASRAGVEIELIIRGICCLTPGVEGMSENIRLIRLVDRFLEHGRVYYFLNGGEEDVFLGSADWMKRNLYHRIEVVFPIRDVEIKKTILKTLYLQLIDNTKAVLLNANQANIRIDNRHIPEKFRAQEDIYAFIQKQKSELD